MSFLKKQYLNWLLSLLIVLGVTALSLLPALDKPVLAQFPTVSIPTVTSSPRGAYIRVLLTTTEYDPINVRSGPGSI